MIRNILKISFRYLIKQKVYAFINIFGLAFGLATCILIFLFIQNELSYDDFHEDASNIVRVEPRWVGLGEDSHWAASDGGLLPSLESRFPEIQYAVKIHFNYQPSIVEYEDIVFSEERILVADSSFFNVFSFNLIQGNPESALSGTGNIVLTESYAKKYFGTEPALNKVIRVDDTPYKISGVIQDIPENSHLHFNIAIALDDLRSRWPGVDSPGPSTFYSYIRVANSDALSQLRQKANEQIWEIYGFDVENDSTGVMEDYTPSLIFQSITDIHLNGHAEKEIEANSNKKYILIFSSIALFVLIIACINYMNLATARSSRRAREVGMRKVLGAHRANIFNQFMAESYIMCIIALVIALIMVEIILPGFNHLTGKHLSVNVSNNFPLLGSLIMIIIVVGFTAGSYPAMFLARLDPMKILRSGMSAGRANKQALYLRRVLVITQFSISVILIIGTLTVYRQLNYIQNKSLGFEKEQLLAVSIPARGYQEKVISFKDELSGNPNIRSSALTSGVPGQRIPFLTVSLPDATESNAEDAASFAEGFGMRVMSGDADVLRTLGIQFAEGRDFDPLIQQDEQEAFIINQAAVEWLELENPIGTKFTYLYNVDPPKEGKIIGVTENFHYASLHSEVEPVMIHIYNPYNRYLIIRLQTDNIQRTVAHIEDTWTEVLPSVPFTYFFLDTYYDNLYKAESNMGTIITYFALLAIIIACLGLFGLASYITEQRTKEIGIRKILGATMGSIIKSLSIEFMVLVLISNIIAWIPAYMLMQDWLDDFAYRTHLAIWVFALASALSFIIAFLTISFQSVKAAMTPPVNAIKYE
jgi:putative ABC transport system permease protein